ncbi:MAG TPA: rRNA adenine N-6-methyltransferase family protein, partial [Gemmatimonadaceae bacterium]|nr:rRNA adenine N-6-methyltransferase family protein [Gemmatimonadaceae bacterium]
TGNRKPQGIVRTIVSATVAERLFLVGAKSFTPPPKVESAVIRIVPRAEPLLRPEEEEPFRVFVQAAFGLRRKQMRRVLRTVWGVDVARAERALAAAGVDPEARPESLDARAFLELLRANAEA